MRLCSVEGCGKKHSAHGMCPMHRYRVRVHGSPHALKINRRATTAEVIAHGCVKDATGCWLWTRTIYPKTGYGVAVFKRRRYLAHRLSYEVHFGAIPEGKQVNHRCHVERCVNPAHLYLGTQLDNVRDMFLRGTRVPSKKRSKHANRG